MTEELKSVTFQSLTADISGNVAISLTPFNIRGSIEKISWKSGTFAENGSIALVASGGSLEANDTIININQCSGNRFLYPREYPNYSIATAPAVSGTAYLTEKKIVNNFLFVWGSGCGAGTSGGTMVIHYR